MKSQLKEPFIPFGSKNMHQGMITGIEEEGTISVVGNDNTIVGCHVLRTSTSACIYKPGDRVVYLAPEEAGELGCVIGHMEPYKPKKDKIGRIVDTNAGEPTITSVEDEVIHIKADKGLVIECGKASITITKEGKIKLNGTDMVSRAKRLSRIKGAAVKIN